MFHMRIANSLAAGAIAVGLALGGTAASAQEKVRVALGDVVSEETLAFIVALERAKERGVDYELTSFAEEELAIQSIVSGQADLGIGTPYAVIQKTKVPLRALLRNVAPALADVQSGYTQIAKIKLRRGDGALVVRLSLVKQPLNQG